MDIVFQTIGMVALIAFVIVIVMALITVLFGKDFDDEYL